MQPTAGASVTRMSERSESRSVEVRLLREPSVSSAIASARIDQEMSPFVSYVPQWGTVRMSRVLNPPVLTSRRSRKVSLIEFQIIFKVLSLTVVVW